MPRWAEGAHERRVWAGGAGGRAEGASDDAASDDVPVVNRQQAGSDDGRRQGLLLCAARNAWPQRPDGEDLMVLRVKVCCSGLLARQWCHWSGRGGSYVAAARGWIQGSAGRLLFGESLDSSYPMKVPLRHHAEVLSLRRRT